MDVETYILTLVNRLKASPAVKNQKDLERLLRFLLVEFKLVKESR